MGHYRLIVAIIFMGLKCCWLNRECRLKEKGKKRKKIGEPPWRAGSLPCTIGIYFADFQNGVSVSCNFHKYMQMRILMLIPL